MDIEADKSPTLISHWENGKARDKRFRLSLPAALDLAKSLAGRSGGLERPADAVSWLGLLWFSLTEDELAGLRRPGPARAVAGGERWQAGLASAWGSRYQAPALPPTHVERGASMAQVETYLLEESDGRTPLVLTGPGGAGKSTLAADPQVRAHL